MTEEKATITADVDFFYQMKGYEGHTQLHIPGTPTIETYEAAIERIEKAGGLPRDAVMPGKAAEAPKDDDGDVRVFNCEACGGPMTYRKGTSKAGKPYKGWFCNKRNCKGTTIWDDD